MGNFRSYKEGAGYYWQNFIRHEEHRYLPDFRYLLPCGSLEDLLEETLLFSTQHLRTSTSSATESCFLQDEFDAPFQADSLSIWVEMEQGAHHKGEKELKQEVGGDNAEKKLEGSEETLFSSTPHLCTSTATSAQSCLSQESFLVALEDGHLHKEDFKRDLDRDAWEANRRGPDEKPLLTFDLVSRYFCMPVKQAAEVLNVGLTHLKRKCREVGIPRWPHRKVKSLETLIKNAQELGKPKVEVERLRQMKKLIEERPGHVQLDQETMVLRQACFKEKFKRRRLMAIQG